MKYDFDTETMRKLFDGHLDVAVLTAQAFVETVDQLIIKCDEDFKSKNSVTAQKSIHQFKGAIAVFGKSFLLDKIKETEQLLKQNNFEAANENYKQLKAETQNFKSQLDIFVNKHQSEI